MNSARRYITKAKCKDCGIFTSVLQTDRIGFEPVDGAVYSWHGHWVLRCRGCKRPKYAHAVAGKLSERHVCGARCMASTGPFCECSCGGKNHGASFSA